MTRKDEIVVPLYRHNKKKNTRVYVSVDAFLKPISTVLTLEVLDKVQGSYIWSPVMSTKADKGPIVYNIEQSNCQTTVNNGIVTITHSASSDPSEVNFQLDGITRKGFAVQHIGKDLPVDIFRFQVHHSYTEYLKLVNQMDIHLFGVINQGTFVSGQANYASAISEITGLNSHIWCILNNKDTLGWSKHMVRNRLYHIDSYIPYGVPFPNGM